MCPGCFFIETASPVHITRNAYDREYMERSYLKRGDVLLSIVGTIGELSLVASHQPATCSCKLAILRPRDVLPEFLAVFLRSEHGQNQIERLTRGAVQKGLILKDMDQLWAPRLSKEFEKRIAQVVHTSRNTQEQSERKQKEAEDTLLEALGLADWTPPEPLSYTARASDVFTSGRMDAEHFHPKFAAAFEHMYASDIELRPLERLIEPIRNGVDLREFVENGTAYIRVGDIKGGRIELENAKRVSATKETVKQSIYMQEGDVLFTRKGSFGNAAVVGHNDQHAIISTEIMLLRLHESIRRQINPDYLAAFFNSSMGKLQAERWAHGVAFYSVTQNDLYKFEIPLIDGGTQEKIADIIGNANRLRDESRRILEAAKRAVEIAIEEGEAAAMAFLDQAEGAS